MNWRIISIEKHTIARFP